MDEELDYGKLAPGIRDTVRWLRANGFRTINSGDGIHHECVCDKHYAFVQMTIEPEFLIAETDRLDALVKSYGIDAEEWADDDFEPLLVHGDYLPGHGALICLDYIDDEVLFKYGIVNEALDGA